MTELPPAFKMECVLQRLTEQLELYAVALLCCTAGYITPMAKAGVFCLTDVSAAVSIKGSTHVLNVGQEGLWAPCKKNSRE